MSAQARSGKLVRIRHGVYVDATRWHSLKPWEQYRLHWEETRVVGEFDGRDKYLKPEYLRGRTPSDVVFEEKVREDRIRATDRNVVRWVWDELNSPGRLERILLDAGVPLRRRASAGHPNSSTTRKRAGDTRI